MTGPALERKGQAFSQERAGRGNQKLRFRETSQILGEFSIRAGESFDRGKVERRLSPGRDARHTPQQEEEQETLHGHLRFRGGDGRGQERTKGRFGAA